MTTPAPSPLPAGTLLEGYRIDRQISCGGFSIVYLAHAADGLPVAIKEYLPQTLARRAADGLRVEAIETGAAEFSRGLACFFEEARALSLLHHPHVVHVLNFFRANDTAYMVMELERGRTLREHVRLHRGRIAEPTFRTLYDALLDGLEAVHQHGLLHLDIKPANIWLRCDLAPVLLDFGAARFAVDLGPPAPRAMYTPGYAAPEQYHGQYTLGPWSDIYAIGACMYATLTKRAPQDAEARLTDDQLIPARQRFADRYSPRLLVVIDECLRLDPKRRPPGALALKEMLAHATSGGWPGWLRGLRNRLQP
ncbi:MAG: serine/threonine protein kinase [Betaproteobacteria bacterium HGW-Betaproteobacteria-11]|nr:MAG: serine/threonine protein kinase [Betaproteobacteria bacterium HGW-Betaproteobacteria-11]